MPTLSGYGLRYRGKTSSADGFLYQVWLWQKDYAGALDNVYLSNEDPISISWGMKGSDIYVPILASKAKINGIQHVDQGSEFDDLIGARTGDWRLEIQRGTTHDDIDNDLGTRIWLGSVLPDVFRGTTMGEPSTLDVEANDGIGALKDLFYYDTDTTPGERLPYEGRVSLLTVLRRALGKIGYDLPVRSAIAWRPDAWTAGEDPLAELDIDQLAFYSPEGYALSCYEVIAEIARRLGARICQHEGAWWIVSRELMTGTAYTYHKYTAAGAADGTDTAGTGVDALGAGVIRTAGQYSFTTGFSSVGVVQNHGPVPPLVDEGDFEVSITETTFKKYGRRWTTTRPVYVSGSWGYTGNADAREADPDAARRHTSAGNTSVALRNFVHSVPSYFHGDTDVPATIKNLVVSGTLSTAGPHYAERTGSVIAAGQVLTFAGSVLIEHNEGAGLGLFNTYWSILIDGTNHYLNRDGTWSESASELDRTQYLVEPGEEYGDVGINLGVQVPFKYVSAPAPASGAIRLRVYGSSDPGFVITNDLDPGDVLWDDVAVMVTDTEGETLTSRRTEVFVVDLPDPAREDIAVIMGEGPSQELPTTLKWGGATAEDWSSARLTTPRTLDQLHAETVLRHHLVPLKVRQETYRNLSIPIIAPLKVGACNNPAQFLTWKLYHNIAEGEWVKLAWDGSTAVAVESAATDDGIYQRQPGPNPTGSIPAEVIAETIDEAIDAIEPATNAGSCFEIIAGTAQILAGATSVTVVPSPKLSIAYNFGSTAEDPQPITFQLTPLSDMTPAVRVWPANRTTTSFDIVVDAAVTADTRFSFLVSRLKTEISSCYPCWRIDTWHDFPIGNNSTCTDFAANPFQHYMWDAHLHTDGKIYMLRQWWGTYKGITYAQNPLSEIELISYDPPRWNFDTSVTDGNTYDTTLANLPLDADSGDEFATAYGDNALWVAVVQDDGGGGIETQLWKYTIATDSWSQMTSLASARAGGALVYFGGDLHFIGGTSTDGPSAGDSETHFIYDIGTDSWSAGPRIFAGTYDTVKQAVAIEYIGNVYLIGGQKIPLESGGANSDQLEILKYNGTVWAGTGFFLPGRRDYPRVGKKFISGASIHIVGGYTGSGTSISRQHLRFIPGTSLTDLPRDYADPSGVETAIDGFGWVAYQSSSNGGTTQSIFLALGGIDNTPTSAADGNFNCGCYVPFEPSVNPFDGTVAS